MFDAHILAVVGQNLQLYTTFAIISNQGMQDKPSRWSQRCKAKVAQKTRASGPALPMASSQKMNLLIAETLSPKPFVG